MWFERLIDFYRDVDMKPGNRFSDIGHALGETAGFLLRNLGMPVFG